MKRETNVAMATDVTKDIGLFLSTFNDRHIKTKQMDFLNELKEAYKFDLDNQKFFSKEEKEKWKKIFNDDFKNMINLLTIIK